jgi:hypothetical protein
MAQSQTVDNLTQQVKSEEDSLLPMVRTWSASNQWNAPNQELVRLERVLWVASNSRISAQDYLASVSAESNFDQLIPVLCKTLDTMDPTDMVEPIQASLILIMIELAS